MNEKKKNSRVLIVSVSISIILVAIVIYILAINGKFKVIGNKVKNSQSTTEQKFTYVEPTNSGEKEELNATLGELKAIVDSEGNPKQSEFVINGIILLGNRHIYYNYKSADDQVIKHIVENEDGYKSTELNSLFYLNEYIQFYISTDYAGSDDDVKIIVAPHKNIDEFEKMSFDELKNFSTNNGGFVMDYIKPDENNYKYVGENYVSMDYPAGKYDILFTYKGQLAYYINIELVKEPEQKQEVEQSTESATPETTNTETTNTEETNQDNV